MDDEKRRQALKNHFPLSGTAVILQMLETNSFAVVLSGTVSKSNFIIYNKPADKRAFIS